MSGISDYISAFRTGLFSSKKQLSGLAFIDVEVGIDDKKTTFHPFMHRPHRLCQSSTKGTKRRNYE